MIRLFFLFQLVVAGVASAATVVVDTGHTSKKPGAYSASGYAEHSFNNQLTGLLVPALTARGLAVQDVAAAGLDATLMSRTSKSSAADLFLSIHHDSIKREWIDAGRAGEFSGFAVFVSKKNPSYAKSLVCARQIGEALVLAGEHPSLYHAVKVAGENRPLLDEKAGVHEFTELVVLKSAPVPAVLIEIGVIANPREEIRLAQTEFAKRISAAIASAIVRCVAPESS